jgi:hypothetical protein
MPSNQHQKVTFEYTPNRKCKKEHFKGTGLFITLLRDATNSCAYRLLRLQAEAGRNKHKRQLGNISGFNSFFLGLSEVKRSPTLLASGRMT